MKVVWKEIVGCYNPYQSFRDWFFARWKCPKCGTLWERETIMDDLTSQTIERGIVTEKRLVCPKCGFEMVVWRRQR